MHALGTPTRRSSPGALDPGVWAAALLTLLLLTPPANANLLRYQKISSTQGMFHGPLEDQDFFGAALTFLPNFDPPNSRCIAVGTIFASSPGKTTPGALWLLDIDANGNVAGQKEIGDVDLGGQLPSNGRFGVSVVDLGDLDGAGPYARALAVGEDFDNDGGPGRGAVWILFFDSRARLLHYQKISNTQGQFSGLLHDHDNFGSSLAFLGDIDGAGPHGPALAVGASGDHDGCADGQSRGAVWILFLNPDGTVQGQQKTGGTNFPGVLGCTDLFGGSIASLGDLDGPGGSAAAIAVGAAGDGDGGPQRGAVWILSLNSDGGPVAASKISSTAGGFLGHLDDGDNFGASVATLGDIDGDGVPDIAVGTTGDDDGAQDAGAAWVLTLNAGGTVKAQQKISVGSGAFGGTLHAGDHFGFSVAGLGDVDGDGVADLAVGAPQDDDGGVDRGAVWILFLPHEGPCCFGPTCGLLWEPICDLNGGAYGGDGQPCGLCNNVPLGACCFGSYCLVLSSCSCDAAGGSYQGDNTPCDPTPCPEAASVANPPGNNGGIRSNRILGAPHPDPASQGFFLPVDLPATSEVHIELVDVNGRRVDVIFDGPMPAGHHDLAWTPVGRPHGSAASGVYFLKLVAGSTRESRPVVITR